MVTKEITANGHDSFKHSGVEIITSPRYHVIMSASLLQMDQLANYQRHGYAV